MLTPFRKILLILVLTTLAGYISLPKEMPVGMHFKNINIENTFRRQDLVISRGRFQIKKSVIMPAMAISKAIFCAALLLEE